MVSERTDIDQPQAGERAVPMDDDSAPFFMYIHYLTDVHMDQYPLYLFQLEGAGSLDDHIKNAIEDIIDGVVKEISTDSSGNQHWRVYSYLAFVLNSDERITSVNLTHEGSNHSFDEIGSISNYNGCSAVYFLNKRLRRSPRRRLRKDESEVFRWEVHHTLAGAGSTGGIDTHESSTTNTGP